MTEMRTEHRKLELKLELTEDELTRIRTHPILSALTIGRPATRTLRSIYFDTPTYALREHSASLRIHRVAKQWVQTIELSTGLNNDLGKPIEDEVVSTLARPDLAAIKDESLRHTIENLVTGQRLRPVFETIIRRTTRNLKSPCGGEIKVAFYRGIILSNLRKKDIYEVELKSGEPKTMYSVASEIFADETIRLARSSRAERGYRIANDETDCELRPTKSTKPAIRKKQSVQEAFEAIFVAAADQVLCNWRVVLESNDPEGIHQFRIGLRRLRSALSAFRPSTQTKKARTTARAARDLARLVSKLRDADVLIQDIVDPVAEQADDEPGLSTLRNRLISYAAHERARVRSTLKSHRWSHFRLQLAVLKGEPASLLDRRHNKRLKRCIDKHALKAIEKCWADVADWGNRIAELNVEERHFMRKSLKKLRYTAEFFAPLYQQKHHHLPIDQIKHLQDVFGYLNDVSLAKRLKQLELSNQDGRTEVHRALGYVLGWHHARSENAWLSALAHWKNLEKAHLKYF